jgi:CDP-diacylglycerol---glycerol-3-phosphate 3-phosphatidyltransferase
MLKNVRPAVGRVLDPIAGALARTPLTPNAVTIIGTLGVSGAALWLFPVGEMFPGAMTCTIFVLLDMLDGALARAKGTSGKWGAFLDSTLDRVADAAIFTGLAWWFLRGGHNLVLGGVSLFCLASGALVSYVKARAEGLGLPCANGLVERPERMLISLIAVGVSGLGVPYILPIGLWGLAAGSAVTLWQRMRSVYLAAQGSAAQGSAAEGSDETT